jgi:uncharacterized caspase-like protein
MVPMKTILHALILTLAFWGLSVGAEAQGLPASPSQGSVSAPVLPVRQAQGLYLLAIGVDKYPPPYALASSVKNVHAIGDVFADGAGLYGAYQARLLADEEATRENILSGLRWLADQVGEGDTGVVFLAGHAGLLSDNQYQFVPFDGRGDMTASVRQSVSGEVIARTLLPVRGRLLVMADTVGAGALARSLVSGVRPNARLAVLLSSTADEMAAEDRHYGIFTQAVTEGFRLVSGDGYVRPLALSRYVADRVRTLSDGNQNPVIYLNGPDDPIARVRK